MKAVRVYIVDDSSLTRRILTHVLDRDPEIEVVGSAPNGKVALEEIQKLKPDVLTLDIEMPVMNGLEMLGLLMTSNPLPVVIVSSFSTRGAELTFRALDMGAVDFIAKPNPDFPDAMNGIESEIAQKVKHASAVRVQKSDSVAGLVVPPAKKKCRQESRLCENVIAVGISAGGPHSLKRMIPQIPGDINAGILIVQHMPPGFTKTLADRLNAISEIDVREADDGSPLVNGRVLIARGGYHLSVSDGDSGMSAHLSLEEKISRFRPSIDVLMYSVSARFRDRAIGVLMTGMGYDGTAGLKCIRKNRGRVIVQDESTSVIFGMNRMAIEQGLADRISPLDQIVPTLLTWTGTQ